MGPFEFANTTVRSGSRLRDGLLAIANSDKEGALRERAGDLALIEILASNDVIDFYGEDTYSVGRKWRSAMCKMGFLFDKYERGQNEIGSVDFITPNGRRLVEADSLAAQQESFLRAIAAVQLKFNGRSYKTGPGFSPFKHIATIMLKLEAETGSSAISFIEFAAFAQFDPFLYSYEEILRDIAEHRAGRPSSDNKKLYDTRTLEKSVLRHGRVALSSYIDYADENLRYLKTTGCFTSVGRGLAISSNKKDFIVDLISSIKENGNYVDYWKNITDGNSLPTDNEEVAYRNLKSLQIEASSRGIPFSKVEDGNNIKDLNNARYNLEELIALNQELDFAHSQASKWEEILQYLAVLLPKGARPEGLVGNIEVEIPRGEGPAYLEWAVWRAFLAINKLKNPPYESRKFKIDRDFLPISHAPGKGPDLVFEFENYVLIVEVTLLTTDRQATAEQVGVRRHVYEIAKSVKDKPVYCLFLAPSIKNETARDFRKASYEEDDGSDLDLTIIPLTLATFMQIFASMLRTQAPDSELFRTLIDECAEIAKETSNTSVWMSAIENTFLAKAN
jgi:hypothetical protein